MDTQHEEKMEPTGNPERDMDEGRHEPESDEQFWAEWERNRDLEAKHREHE